MQTNSGRLITASYKDLITNPSVGSVVLGLGSRFALVATAVRPQQVALTITSSSSSTFTAPAMQIGDRVIVDYLPEQSTVVIASGYDLYLNSEIDIYYKIAGTA